MTDAALRRRYFAILLLAQAMITGWLLFSHRMPRGHDTLSVFLMQYLFLAQPGSGAGVALWMPQLAHGVTSAWFANLQTGLLQNTLLLFGGVPEGTPMLPITYAGLFLEDLVLLLGVWRLGARFYRTPSAQFFVAAAAIGSSMWASNIYWSHRLLYGVPLLISLLLDFVETGKRARLLLAASLGCLLLLGNAAYIPVLSGLSTILFLALHLVIHRKRLRPGLPLLRPRPSDLLWIAAIAVLVTASVTAVVADLGSIRQYQRGRNPDGSVTLDTFLTYPGGLNPLRYADLALGLNLSADFSLYAGLCTLLLAFLALPRRPCREVLALFLTLLLLVLFSMGFLSWVGMAGYEALPPLRYFRYVALTGGLAKIFLMLLSGFGFEALIRDQRRGPGPLRFAAAAAGLLSAQLLFRALRSPDCSDTVSYFLKKIQGNIVERQPQGGPGLELVFLILIAGTLLLATARWRRGRPFALGIPLVLFLHGIDLLGWRIQIFREATLPLTPEQRATLQVERIPYAVRRTPSDEGNPRAAAFGREIFRPNHLPSGMMYDYGDAFLHRDASWSRCFVTLWSPPLDLLLRAHAGRSLAFDRDPPPPFLVDDPMPHTAPEGFARLIGESEDKLQVFTAAHSARSDEEVAELLHRSDYQGNVLILAAAPEDKPDGLDPALASRNERLPTALRVVEFRPDRIRIEVDVPAGRDEAWLSYADCWHPGWKAAVDGSPRGVRRANLAYKAVALHGGRNVVDFRFHAPGRATAYGIIGLQCLAWSLGLIAASLQLLGVPLPRFPGRAA